MADPNNPGIKSELRITALLGGEDRIGSGALDSCKGDFTLTVGADCFLGECKATEAGSISIKHEWLHKISSEALEINCSPLFTFSFITGNGEAKKRGDWVAIPIKVFKQLMFELEEVQD